MAKKIKTNPYTQPAGNFAALTSVAKQLLRDKALTPATPVLMKMNKPGGVDCPSCAWPDPEKPHFAEFCENGAKAIAAETTTKRVTREFFQQYSVEDLRAKDGYWLEQQGRLAEPMSYNAATGRYEPISWEDAFAKIGQHLKRMENPNQAVFYTSGRTSNEAAFLYQLFVRELGTNNMPDCSNMCHEATSLALAEAVGIGKATIQLSDYDEADSIFIFGQNPGTNHPRMLGVLQDARERGCEIVTINPLKEASMESFIHPQHITRMLLQRPTKITTQHMQVRIGGDLALTKGMIKAMLEAEKQNPGQLDRAFIDTHTTGFEALQKDIEQTEWDAIVDQSGIARDEIMLATKTYLRSGKTILCWCMGITQNKQAVLTIQYLVNLALLKGNIGRVGAGLAPVRGHSNVQGDRTMGIFEKPPASLLDALERVFGFAPPRAHGYGTVEAIEAMAEGKVRVFVGMGGNFASATPDTVLTESGLQKCDLTVHVSTKLNRSHVVTGKEALILPCLGRTERDVQHGVAQKVTVEDSTCMVHASEGKNAPASSSLLSEPAIVAGMAVAALPQSRVNWRELAGNYDLIRDKIAEVFPEFAGYNEKIKQPGGFYLKPSSADLVWKTASGKAQFTTGPLPDLRTADDQLTLTTIRSHDQFNTTVYGLDDRYRNVYGERKVLFMNPSDMEDRGLNNFDRVDITSYDAQGKQRKVTYFRVEPYDIPKGCTAAYFPETNPLVPISSFADKSKTPSSKYVVISVQRSSLLSQ